MKIKKFQEGGVAPQAGAPPQGAPQEQGGQGASPEQQLQEMAMQIIQSLGPEASAALAQMIMQILQQAQQSQQGAPTYAKKGGKLVMLGRK
jgi:hypothetical protein